MYKKIISGLILLFIILFSLFTPLKIYNGTPNGTPNGRLNRDLRATLPFNSFTPTKWAFEMRKGVNVHRCIGEYLKEGYQDLNTDAGSIMTNQIPTTIDQLQLFIKQFNDTQTNIDELTIANINTLQTLINTSKNDHLNTKLIVLWPNSYNEITYEMTEINKYSDEYNAYNSLQTLFNAALPSQYSPERYSPNNVNTTYHNTVDEILKQTDAYGLGSGTAYVYDNEGNKIALQSTQMQGDVTYYTPGAYKYGASSYVPNYEDSVYLSRTTGLSQVLPVRNAAQVAGNMCGYYKNNPTKLEELCQITDINSCASKPCCVLLGGSKCVSGDATGPSNISNYSDIFVKNKDFYYYGGQCFGNCQNASYSAPINAPLPTSQIQMQAYEKTLNNVDLQTTPYSSWKTSTAVAVQ